MFERLVGVLPLGLVAGAAFALYDYTLYPESQRSRARERWRLSLGAWALALVVGLGAIAALVVGAISPQAILGPLAIVAAVPTVAEYLLRRRLDLDGSPLVARLRERFARRVGAHLGESWR